MNSPEPVTGATSETPTTSPSPTPADDALSAPGIQCPGENGEPSDPSFEEDSPPALLSANQLVSEINDAYAYVESAGAVLQEYRDPDTGSWTHRLISVERFKHNVANIPFTFDPEEGERAKESTGNFWLRHPNRRNYHACVFRPEGLTKDEDLVYFNTWTGFGVRPGPGACDLFWAHVHDNIAHGHAEHALWIEAWLAMMVQHPERRASVALVLRGERGTGKGVFAQILGRLLGQHYLHLTSPDILTGRFNRILQDRVLVYADESFWAGDKKAESRLKTLITEDRIVIEEKYLPTQTAKNVMHLIIAGNDDWVVPAGRHERRFGVFQMSEAHLQDRPYFRALLDQMENGGYAALLHELQTFDLEACGLDPEVPPKTEALASQQVYSMSPVEQFWYERLENGRALDFHTEWGEAINGRGYVATAQLYEQYAKATAMGRTRRPGDQQSFTKNLKRLLPRSAKIERKAVRTERWPGDVTRAASQRCFVLPSLGECRRHFEKLFPNLTWDVPAEDLEGPSRSGSRADRSVASPRVPGARALPVRRSLTVVEDNFTEPDWDSDEPAALEAR